MWINLMGIYNYLFINLILVIISKTLMDRADIYWKKGNDTPYNFCIHILSYPIIRVTKYIAMIYGYAWGVIMVLTFRRHRVFLPSKHFHLKLEIIAGVVLILFGLPIFIIGLISEIYWIIYHYITNRKGK